VLPTMTAPPAPSTPAPNGRPAICFLPFQAAIKCKYSS
jgi:hypothetical protein